MNLEPILWAKWTTSKDRLKDRLNVIIGHWAEDDSHYAITVPIQLRDMIVELQNKAVDEMDAKKPIKVPCRVCDGRGYTEEESVDVNHHLHMTEKCEHAYWFKCKCGKSICSKCGRHYDTPEKQ